MLSLPEWRLRFWLDDELPEVPELWISVALEPDEPPDVLPEVPPEVPPEVCAQAPTLSNIAASNTLIFPVIRISFNQ